MDTVLHTTDEATLYPYRVVYATPGFLKTKGFGRVEGLPFIFDHRPRYHRNANQFLIDLALGEWSMSTRGTEDGIAPPPTAVTIKNYADWLANFLDYCHQWGKDPLQVDYMIDIMQGYQNAMSVGTWSRDDKPLAPKTINCRVEIACMYQQWAVDKGLRGPFRIPKVRKTFAIDNPRSSGAATTKTVEARRGKVRESKRRLGFPDEKVIGAWLQRVRDKCPVEGVLAETILETAIRRAEAAAWRVDTLPLKKEQWHIVNQDRPIEHQSVLITLRYGTKGHSYGEDHGDKIGPEGKIHLPMPLALKLDDYRQKVRPKSLTIALRKARNGREAESIRSEKVHLFLNPATGDRFTAQQIYDFWTSERVGCPRGWSPHLARDFWACSVLWKHITAQQQLVEQTTKAGADPSVLKILALDIEGFIERTIKPQLRHVSRETSLIYLQWVSDRLHINLNLQENYMRQIDEEEIDEEEDE